LNFIKTILNGNTIGDKMSNGTFKLSNQALGAVMMALQESLLNELDIVPILEGL
jgi:hypothetical protein